MSTPETLILRRRYPVPVTFADLRAAYNSKRNHGQYATMHEMFYADLKDITGAIDEVYAVVDGREARVVTTDGETIQWTGGMDPEHERATGVYRELLNKAGRAGYWERPHEVRLDLPGAHENSGPAAKDATK